MRARIVAEVVAYLRECGPATSRAVVDAVAASLTVPRDQVKFGLNDAHAAGQVTHDPQTWLVRAT